MTLSRRRVLASVGAAVGSGLTGCTDLGSNSGSGAEPTATRAPAATDAETQFRGGLERHGVSPDLTVPESVEVDWRIPDVNTGDHSAAKASPVLAPNGDVVVPGDNGEIRRVSPSGETVWHENVTDTQRGFHGTPAIANDMVYIGAYDGVMYALDLESGEREWDEKIGGSIGSSPAYYDETVYIAVEYPDPSGAMYALDALTGEVEWDDQRVTDHPHSTCAIDLDAGRLVVGANDGVLYGWSFPDLEFRWEFDTGDAIKGPVATYDGSAFFGSWDHNVYRVGLEEGEEEWRFETGNLVMSGPSIEPSTDTVYIGSHDYNQYALDVDEGDERWSSKTGARLIGCPAVTSEHVVAGSVDHSLYAWEKDSGEEVWSVETEGRVSSTPLVAGDAIYVTSRASPAFLGEADGADRDAPTGALYRLVAAE